MTRKMTTKFALHLNKMHALNCKTDAAKRDIKRDYKSRKAEFMLSDEEFTALLVGDCVYCGAKPSQIRVTVGGSRFVWNGIDRVDSSKGYETGNCVSCCRQCNLMKLDMTVAEFVQHCKKVINFQTTNI